VNRTVPNSHNARASLSSRAFRPFMAIVMAVAMMLYPVAASASGASSRQAREPLGALATVGTVYVNGAPAPAVLTIFAGDTVLTGDNGSATFTMTGKGSLKLSTQTHVTFIGDARFLAELTAGTVIMTSFAQSTDVTLRAGNYVIAPVIQTEQSSSRIDKTATGSFAVSCLDGSVGVIPLEGANGRVLAVGQSVEISPQGDLGVTQEASAPPATNASVKKQSNSHTGYIILGVAAAAGVGAAVALAGHKSSSAVSAAAMTD
jgi:ferric-dicitrate binding protein FerR (iron transport regulator)